jgi:hypothetical protein
MKINTGKKYLIINKLASYVSVFAIVFAIAMPFVVLGACPDDPSCPDYKAPSTSTGNKQPATSTGNPASGVSIDAKINNPLSNNINSIPAFIEAILNIVLTVGVPIVVLAIIYCGFLFVKAQGNSEELGKAKQAFIYTLIGAALLLGAFVIANAIKGTVDEITRTA